ncbi:MAG: SUF system Fe-S cluster assembly regulator [Euryarchaeota archaeon]|uniref:SUF system Fe-S cluster assembly regulator n=1 Tax=Marine Group III euryarchaeote CG-Epi2 TaxID=1888996 RepID=A0A1J5U1B9_9ARCH|nr:SUF system Fe-S cluster assembly regulator [Euryarchaeota archaeon]OIR22565.1 MAG: SUF system Fe-S cluster assembly regulator [Marine Group III euryarchaeote CG-Epi2]|tara:strand:- start:13602 stop:14057 length:456 start_codon:yes stop_codon:yes gene_type:complete
MMRINKLTDYGIVVMTEIATMKSDTVHTAKVISQRTKIPLPTVTRLLKTLSNEGLLDSQRGSQGGYSLSESASTISVASIIESIEGPIALTECSTNECACSYESSCNVELPWQKINNTVKTALEKISLAEMIQGRPNEELVNLSMNYGDIN